MNFCVKSNVIINLYIMSNDLLAVGTEVTDSALDDGYLSCV